MVAFVQLSLMGMTLVFGKIPKYWTVTGPDDGDEGKATGSTNLFCFFFKHSEVIMNVCTKFHCHPFNLIT